jgi:hypothetical protein
VSLSVYVLAPRAAAISTRKFQQFYVALQARFGRGHVLLQNPALPNIAQFDQARMALVWLDEPLPPGVWEQLPAARSALAQSLVQRKLVVPVLSGTARMPAEDELPQELRAFSRKQVFLLSGSGPEFMKSAAGQLAEIALTQLNAGAARWMLGLGLLTTALTAYLVFQAFVALGQRSFPASFLPASEALPYYHQLVLACLPALIFAVWALTRFVDERRRPLVWISLTALVLFGVVALVGEVTTLGAIARKVEINSSQEYLPQVLPFVQTLDTLAGISLLVLAGCVVVYLARLLTYTTLEDRPNAPAISATSGTGVTDVFISYRRSDSGAFSERLAATLQREGKIERVFRDEQGILGGVDFSVVLQSALTEAPVVLAVIGPNWLHARDAQGHERLWLPNDYVRWEIATALRQAKAVIPVLVGGAALPSTSEMPDDLRALTVLSPVRVSEKLEPSESEPLLERVRQVLRPLTQPVLRGVVVGAVVVALLALLIGGLVRLGFTGLGMALVERLHAENAIMCKTPSGTPYPCTASALTNTIYIFVVALLLFAETLALPVAFSRMQRGWLSRNLVALAVFAVSAAIYAYTVKTVYFGWDYNGEGRIMWLQRTAQPLNTVFWSWWIALVALAWLVAELYLFSRGSRGLRFTPRSQVGLEQRAAHT